MQLRSALTDSRLTDFLESSQFHALPAEDKLAGLVGEMERLNLPLESENLAQIYTALPAQVTSSISKREIQKIELPMRVFNQVRDALQDERLQTYLESGAYRALPAEDELAGLVGEMARLNLPLESENLAHIYSSLPAQVTSSIAKRDIQQVNLPMRVFNQVREALQDERLRTYLESASYRTLPAEDKLASLVAGRCRAWVSRLNPRTSAKFTRRFPLRCLRLSPNGRFRG